MPGVMTTPSREQAGDLVESLACKQTALSLTHLQEMCFGHMQAGLLLAWAAMLGCFCKLKAGD